MWVVIRRYVVPDLDDELLVVEPICVIQVKHDTGFDPSVVLRDIASRLGIDHRELSAYGCEVVTV